MSNQVSLEQIVIGLVAGVAVIGLLIIGKVVSQTGPGSKVALLFVSPTPSSTPTATTTPTASASPTPPATLTPMFTVTPSRTPRANVTATLNLDPTFLAINVKEYPTVYGDRALWESVVGETRKEDFSGEASSFDVISLPFLTAGGFLLDGDSSVQIVQDSRLMDTGTFLQISDRAEGLTFMFPNGIPVKAFGFEFRSQEEWNVYANEFQTPLPSGRPNFVGFVLERETFTLFNVFCLNNLQGGLTLDNISYAPLPGMP